MSIASSPPWPALAAHVPDPLDIARANFSKIVDCRFVFEGELRRIDPRGNPGPFSGEEDCQGTYTYRSVDGATHLEVYHQQLLGNPPLKHTVDVLLKGDLSRIDHTFDLERRGTPIMKRNGAAGSLNTTTSPEPFVPFWHLRDLLLDRKGWGYRPEGTEVVHGHECHKVEFNELPEFDIPDKPSVHYRMDLERGGLPLKIEYSRKRVVGLRTHSIRIETFRTPDGQQVYFPVAGITEISSRERGDVPDEPKVRDECTVVPSSLVLNKNLGDEVFAVRREPRNVASPALGATRSRFDEASRHPRTSASFRTDPAGVRATLEKNLAEADGQAKQIEASSMARNPSPGDQAGRMIAGASVVVLIVAVFLASRRGR